MAGNFKPANEKKQIKMGFQVGSDEKTQNLHSKISPSRGHLLVEKGTILAIWLRLYIFLGI